MVDDLSKMRKIVAEYSNERIQLKTKALRFALSNLLLLTVIKIGRRSSEEGQANRGIFEIKSNNSKRSL